MSKVNTHFIESYFKTSGSSDCDFSVELEETIATREHAVCYIDDIVIPNVFKTIEARNNKLYINIDATTVGYHTIINVDHGYYNGFSFAQELTNKLKAFTDYIHEMRDDLIFDITVSYDLLINTLKLQFIDKRPHNENDQPDPIIITIFSNNDLLKGAYQNIPINNYNLQSINECIGNINNSIVLNSANTSFDCVLNLASLKSIYLYCSELSSNNTISNVNQNNIIKKVILNSNQNEINITQSGNNVDYIEIGKKVLKTLHFRLMDKFSNILNLYGQTMSFTITILDN
jgi:hypothetical protein